MKKKILFEASEITPEITFVLKTGFFVFEGYSLPNNPFDFYKQVISKIIQEIKNNKLNQFTLKFNLRYFNTASTKSFHELIKKLVEFSLEQKIIFSIVWNLENEDDDVKETVLILKELFNQVPFTINEIN